MTHAPQIDLNSDVGESFGSWTMGDDAAIMPSVSSANVACGFHAGDPSGIAQTCRDAVAAGVGILAPLAVGATVAAGWGWRPGLVALIGGVALVAAIAMIFGYACRPAGRRAVTGPPAARCPAGTGWSGSASRPQARSNSA